MFVYDKSDNSETRTATLKILHSIFVEKHRTADYQMTRGLCEILEREGNEDDLVAFMQDKMLPIDESRCGASPKNCCGTLQSRGT